MIPIKTISDTVVGAVCPAIVGAIAAAVMGLAAPVTAAEPELSDAVRVWADRSGKYSVTAQLTELQEDAVVLKTKDGRTVTVPIVRLCPADQKHVKRLRTAREEQLARERGLRYEKPTSYQVRVGLEATAKGGPCKKLTCSFPVPLDWPEQKVTVVSEDASPLVRGTRMQVLSDGAKQLVFQIPRLPAGATAQVVLTLEIQRWHIQPPEDPDRFVFARQIDPKLRPFLGESPLIEIKHDAVKAAAAGIELDDTQTAWRQVETHYDWTCVRVHSDGTKPLKGALAALTSGTGDCEERTSLFVAMCRLKKIPARSVWIEGHTYPEFYLEDDLGNGHWIPCESLGERNFGGVHHHVPILQKGDSFRMSQKEGPQRYVTPTVSCMITPGSGQPVLREIREKLDPSG